MDKPSLYGFYCPLDAAKRGADLYILADQPSVDDGTKSTTPRFAFVTHRNIDAQRYLQLEMVGRLERLVCHWPCGEKIRVFRRYELTNSGCAIETRASYGPNEQREELPASPFPTNEQLERAYQLLTSQPSV